MKDGFTFNWASLKILRKVIFKIFCGGGGQKRAVIAYKLAVYMIPKVDLGVFGKSAVLEKQNCFLGLQHAETGY